MSKKIQMLKLGVLTLLVFVIISVVFFSPIFSPAWGIGDNVTVATKLGIGNVFPEVILVSLGSPITLSPNATVPVNCYGVVRDYNGESDIKIVYSELFDNVVGHLGDADDNNYHLNNSNCTITKAFTSFNGYTDDAYSVLANCSYNISYYANPGTWNCTVIANDTSNYKDSNSSTATVSGLLALGVPALIDYGTVNATLVSDEVTAQVTNFGNVMINLSLSGYGANKSDGLAMNCTLGNVQNISIIYERFNTTSSPGSPSLSIFNGEYRNLTSTSSLVKFNLNYRQNDTVNEAVNNTYWRIYVPRGVAGNCSGNIIFGAVQTNGT